MKSLSQRKAEEKKLLEKLKREEEELEKEIEKEHPEEKFTLSEALSLLKGKDEEDLEYESYLTEEELASEYERKKDQIKIAKFAGSIIILVIVAAVIGTKFFYDTFKSDLLKVTEPMLKEYYLNTYGTKLKTKSIEEFKVKNGNNETVGTGIYLLTTEEDKHIMSVNNELIGDDINISGRKEYISNYIRGFLENAGLVTHSVDLSYQDYYLEFNRFLDYINVLPSNMSDEELINSNKLTVTYKGIYTDDLDIEGLRQALNTFSDASSFIFLKQSSSGITGVTLIKKDKVIDLNVTAEIEKDTGLTYLELNRDFNAISNVNIRRFVDSSVKNFDNYRIINPIKIELEIERQGRDEAPKDQIYLLKFDEGIINESTFVQLSSYKRDDEYTEQEKEKYQDVYLISVGSYTYIIGESDILIGRKAPKKSFLCNLGIC